MTHQALVALALSAAVAAAAGQPEQQPCASPIFIGALDLGGGLAVAFRSVGSRWLELRGTAGFEVRQAEGDGRWHAANVSSVAERNPSGSNVINLAPVPGLSRQQVSPPSRAPPPSSRMPGPAPRPPAPSRVPVSGRDEVYRHY